MAFAGNAGLAAADTKSFSSGCPNLWTVPVGVSSVAVDATGAAGTAGTAVSGGSPGQGGAGGHVTGTISVTHGQVLDVCVGIGGASGVSGTNPGGSGGGAAGVAAGSDFSSPAVVAGGGGGGGASSSMVLPGGKGGDADTGGATPNLGGAGGTVGNGSSASASGPGAGQQGAGPGNAGGGGGGGNNGGGGGQGSTTGGGGGGAGGSNFCASAVSACSKSTGNGPPQVILSYTVASAPTISITTPANGATYPLNGSVASNFSCSDGSGGPGIASCTDQNGHTSGSPFDTSSTGHHSFTVTATSSDGESSTASVTYNDAATPKILLGYPGNGAVYTQGQSVNSAFICSDGTAGPGLSSCVDQNGRASGAPIDTSTIGPHTFTVTATSSDGQTTTASATYTIVPPPTVSNPAQHHGSVTFDITLQAPGAVDAMGTTSFSSFAVPAVAHAKRFGRNADTLQPSRGTIVYGRADILAGHGGTFSVTVTLSQAGKLLLRDHSKASIQVVVSYTGTNGLPQTIATLALKITR